MSMAIVPDCRGLYSTWEDVQREQPATPDPLLAIVTREAARIEHPVLRGAQAYRTNNGVILHIDFVDDPNWKGFRLQGIADRVKDAIRRDLPEYRPFTLDNPAFSCCGRGFDIARQLNMPPWLDWFSMKWEG